MLSFIYGLRCQSSLLVEFDSLFIFSNNFFQLIRNNLWLDSERANVQNLLPLVDTVGKSGIMSVTSVDTTKVINIYIMSIALWLKPLSKYQSSSVFLKTLGPGCWNIETRVYQPHPIIMRRRLRKLKKNLKGKNLFGWW